MPPSPTHTLSPHFSFPFLSISVSFSGFQLISSPQLQSLFHQQKELHRLLKAMPLSALLPSPHYTQWRAKTSLSLCLSAPNWPPAAGARGRGGLSLPRWSDRWTRLETSGFKCHTHFGDGQGGVTLGMSLVVGESLTQQEGVCSHTGTDRRVEGLYSSKLTQHIGEAGRAAWNKRL